ncbi:ABC transporter permease [Dubosiella muris]|uniref:ABC transporter permease n=1 Tax=Dubosiella muris TaxID=3038133 RepID=A0AC61R6P3_9FIRM|nr:FtsX-like permease family protein [Dubosiella muris]TGY65558.1 ABC transporter permease [Dubosiella muris]
MTFRDLWRMCLNNLKRRKSRTILTVLGVMIGCMSIVVMVSIGVAMDASQKKMLESMGDLRMITIYPNYDPTSQTKLDEAALDSIKAIPGVQAASGKFEIQDYPITISTGSNGRYEAMYAPLVGIDFSELEGFGYELKDGTLPIPGAQKQALAGERFAYNFKDTARPDGSNTIDYYSMLYDENGNMNEDNLPDPYFDPLNAKVDLSIAVDEQNKFKETVTVTGRLKENYMIGYETGEGLLIDMNEMKTLWKDANRKAGKPSTTFNYSGAMVKADAIENVSDIEKQIQGLGFQTNSMESMRESMEESTRMIQMVLGGIGAVSLLVAAIGITNTMIMSITERTREIGIMKALGCFTKNIRALFLMEAGMIGLIGGVAGLALSFVLSMVMNSFANAQAPAQSFGEQVLFLFGIEGTPLSVIPWWLALFALLFSVLIGVVSGYYPASKAVKVPALEAIRHE